MRAQLEALAELQKLDLVVRELDIVLEEIPRKVKELAGDVDRVKMLLERERAELADAEKTHREVQVDLQSQNEQLARSKTKASVARNQKEYDASQRELESMRKSLSDRETEILKLLAAIETFRASIMQHESEFGELQKVLDVENAEAQARMLELEAKKGTYSGARAQLSSKIQKQILRRYDVIRQKRGIALAEVKDGTCLACHMQIPPQLFNELQRLETLEICPNCNRILFWIDARNGTPTE